jgi:hypothetical protein
MAKRHELTVRRQALHRRLLEHDIVSVEIVGHAGLQHEKRAIDPTLRRLRFLIEFDNAIAVEFDMSIPRRRTHCGHGGEFAMRAVKGEKFVEIDVRDTIAPGEHEGAASHPLHKSLDAAAGRFRTCIISRPSNPERRTWRLTSPVAYERSCLSNPL